MNENNRRKKVVGRRREETWRSGDKKRRNGEIGDGWKRIELEGQRDNENISFFLSRIRVSNIEN